MSARRAPRGGAGGQATVELALSLPFLALLLLASVQVALVAHRQVLVVHGAREAVRAAAVVDDPAAARTAAAVALARAVDLDPGRVAVTTTVDGDLVRVEVTYRAATDVPLVGALLHDVDLVATATMQREGATVGGSP